MGTRIFRLNFLLLFSLALVCLGLGQDGISVGVADSRYSQLSMLRTGGWSLGSSMSSISLSSGKTFSFASGGGQWSSVNEYLAPFDSVGVQAVDWNTQKAIISSLMCGEVAGNNPVIYSYVLVIPSTSDVWNNTWLRIPITFGGAPSVTCYPTQIVYSDKILCPKIPAGGRYFIIKTSSCVFGARPSAPSVSVGNGSYSVSAGVYQFAYTVVYPNGFETPISSPQSATLANSGTNGTATITMPAASSFPGARCCHLYVTWAGGGATGTAFNSGLGDIPFAATPIWPNNSTDWNSINQYKADQRSLNQLYMPTAFGGIGGNSATNGGRGTGDYTATYQDYTVPGSSPSQNAGNNQEGPIGVMLLAADGKPHPSAVMTGESIEATNGMDNAFGYNRGNWFNRVCLNQTSAVQYTNTITPYCGYMNLACPSEAASTYNTWQYGGLRQALEPLASTGVTGYGVNDGYQQAYYTNIIQMAARRLNMNMSCIQKTLFPRNSTSSTAGFDAISTQTFYGTNFGEFWRRQINSFILNSGGAKNVPTENLYRAQTSPLYGPASSMYGGDGSSTIYEPSQLCQEGSETVKKNGVTLVAGTDYTYGYPVTINGSVYATEILPTVAPANGATMTIAYTTAPGWAYSVVTYMGLNPTSTGSALLSKLNVWDIAAAVEVDGSGNPGTNKGFWAVTSFGNAITSTATSGTSQFQVVDSAQTMTPGQYIGYDLVITADAGTPSLVGQTSTIYANTATTFMLSNTLSAVPDVGATYIITKRYTTDGTHPTTVGAKAASVVCNKAYIQ